MTASTTLPVMAGLSILGAALGVGLGRSAIAEINPAYFTDPETTFHADLVPYRSADWAQVQAAEYEQAQADDGLGTGCVGCREYPEEYHPRPEPAVDGYADGWSGSAPDLPADAVARAAVEEAPREEWVRIGRYASYPVSAEEAEAGIVYTPAEEVYAAAE